VNTILTSTSGGLDARDIEPFFSSLRLTGYRGAVIVFVSNVSPACRALLEDYQARTVDFDYRGIPTLQNRTQRVWQGLKGAWNYYRSQPRGRQEPAFLFFNNSRFFAYHDYLLRVRDKPGLVMLADIRDVVFQRDPFSFPYQPGLSVASENTRRRIIHSRGAIKGMFESVGLLKTCRCLRHTIICAGTTIADYATMMRYLELITSDIKKRFFYALFDGIDQGLHTYYAHHQPIAPVQCFINWHGPFLTLDREVILPECKNHEGYLCNRDGSVIPIVHQYDRVKELYRPGETRPECWKLYR
jgi:hypothetical protein